MSWGPALEGRWTGGFPQPEGKQCCIFEFCFYWSIVTWQSSVVSAKQRESA